MGCLSVKFKSVVKHSEYTITTTIATRAIHQLVEQLFTADCESVRPIAMIIGPVTIGGKNLITLLALNILIRSASKR